MPIERFYKPYVLKRATNDGYSQSTPDTASTVGVYQGCVQPVSSSESGLHFKTDSKSAYLFFSEMRAPVQYGDYVIQDGETYTVTEGDNPQGISAQGHHKEFGCERYGKKA